LNDLGLSNSAILWFKSYISNRKQAVRGPKGELSNFSNVHKGVPQGSILGPLLFSIYINDLSKVITNCKYHMYADDLQIYIDCYPAEVVDAIAKVNDDIKNISKWSTENYLRLNPRKTKSIIIGSNVYVNRIIFDNLPKITVQGVQI
jgi:hypothetical protein